MSNWSYTRVGAKDGKGIQSITEYYKLSANTTETFSASTISTWSTSVSQPTSAKPYLLNAELVVYSDGTKEYKAPHVASRYVTDGQAGRGITGITEYYLATSEASGITRSTSGWTTTIQTMTSTKKYLWNYEETTYTDDSDPSYTNPCIIGVYGDKGDQGNPGTAAKFVEIEAASGLVFKNGSPSQLPLKCIATGFTASSYQWYKNGTVISGATSQTYNATTAGVYKVTANGYSDIATVISVSDGADGNDGRGISSTEIKYATSTSNTTAPSSGWQSTVPSVAQGSYLWTRTTIKYTSGSDSVSYTVARQGSNGTNGSDGTSVTISSKSVKYQAGTSGTTAPSGTWSDTVPSVTKGQYLWTKTEVTYSDGNSTTSYSVGYAGTNGTNGTSPYACSVSNENFTVATGTDLKPLSATTYSVKFTAYKGSTQLSAIAPSATIASGKFKVSTPTATGFTVAQSTNGTLTFTTATGTAISANLSVNVTVTYDNGSTETKTITISASKTGAKGATGTSSYSYVRYSANADGTDFTTTPSSATKYVGFYSGTSSTAPTDKASYTWTKFVGEDGANGTSLTSKGNWASGTAYKVSEVVYYATNKTSYVCKKAHTSSSSILPTNTTYWTVLAAPGTDGTNGTNGTNGQDATQYYMHFVYCDDTSSGTNYSTTESRKYVGIYTDTTQADAATFSAANAKSSIVWSKAEGDDGRGITSITNVYKLTTNTTKPEAPAATDSVWTASATGSTSVWGTVCPTTTTTNKYLWNCERIEFDDGTYTVTPVALMSTHGSTGTRGALWYSGTGITGTSTTATVFANSGVSSAIVGDMYKNTDTGYTYRCTTAGNASTAKWVYDGSIKGDPGARGFSSRTIAFRANYSAFSSPNVGEVYVCGYNSNGAEADTAGYVIVNGVTYYSKGKLNSNAAMDGYIVIPKTSTSSSSPSRPEYAYYSGSGWYKIANDLTSGNVDATSITAADYIALAKVHAYSAEGIVTVTPITHCLLSSITQPIDLYYEGIVATVTQYTNASITPYKITRSGDGYTKTAITARNARRGAVVFDTRAATPTASTAAPTIRFYNGTYWNEISSSNALYSKAVAIMAGDLLGIAGYYRTKELPIPSICGTYMETMYCNLALIENLFSQQATIDELQSLSLLFSEYCGSVNSQNPSVGDMMIYMGKNPRLNAATREFRFAISQYLGKIGGQEMWSDKLVTKFLAGGLLALNLMGCVQTTDAVYSKVGESNTWKEVDLDGSDTSPIYSVSGDSINGLFAVIKYDGSIFITKDFESYTRSNSLKNMLTDENLVDVAVVHGSNQTCLILTNKKLFKTHDYQTFQNISPWQSAASTGNIINFWRKKNTLFVCRNNVLFLTSANDENFSQWQTVSLSESPSEILCVDDCLVAVEQNKIELIKKTENGFAIEEYDNYFSDVDIGSFFLLSKDNLIVAVGTSGIAICKKDYSGIESVKNYPTTSFGGMWANKVFYNNKLFCCISAPGDTTFALYSIDFSSDTPSVEKKLDFPSGSYGAFFVGVCGDLVWTCFTGTPVYISTDGGNTFSQKIDPPNNTAYFRGMSYISELNLYMGSWTYSSDSSTHFFVSRGREAGSGIIAENFSPNMGYVVWSNGLIVQWGATSYSGTTLTKTNYPIVFPNAVGCVVLQNYVASGSSEVSSFVYSADKTGFTPASKWGADNTVTGSARSYKYMAIGY